MKFWIAGAALALTLTSPSAQADPDWVPFQGPAFTVDVPRPPTITTEPNVENTGETVPVTKYLIDEGSVALIVMDADFTDSPNPIAVDNAVRGLQSGGRVLTAESVIARDGHEGRSVTVTDPNGYQIVDIAFVIGRHFYQVLTVVPKEATAEQTAECARFTQSFHFTAP